MKIAWTLSDDGRELAIYKLDQLSRRLRLILPLRRNKAMTEAEAQRYVDDNYPNDGAVKAAADTLGLLRRGR